MTQMTTDPARPGVVVVGGASLDILAVAGNAPVPGDSTPGKVLTSAGGVARNLAENLARLDIHTSLVSAVGDDNAGDRLLREANGCGIDVSGVVTLGGARTASYNAFVDHRGETQQAVSDMGIFDKLSLGDFPLLGELLAQSDCCIVDTNLPADMIVELAEQCTAIPLICEAVSRSKCLKLLPVLDSIALLKVNKDEALQLLGSVSADASATSLASDLLARGVTSILMSLGEKGIVYADADHCLQLAGVPVEVVSVNGAGDALLAAVVAARLCGEPVPAQLQWGLRAAALTCASQSAVTKAMARDQLV